MEHLPKEKTVPDDLRYVGHPPDKSVLYVLVPRPSFHMFASDFWLSITGLRARHLRDDH